MRPSQAPASPPDSEPSWRGHSPDLVTAPYRVKPRGRASDPHADGPARCIFLVPSKSFWDDVRRKGAYMAALAYINGEIDIQGDFSSAVRICMGWPSAGWRDTALSLIARLARSRLPSILRSRFVTARQIRFHYDRSNEFYQQFLDKRMVYSCAYFRHDGQSLEAAQESKLDHICRKLDLQPGDRFLDIGCGWGGLILHAAAQYNVAATGCTLSLRQAEFARRAIAERGLNARAALRDCDYRDVTGQYKKIASVGMFEHVGPHGQNAYFQKIYSLLDDDGLFLNHAIVRPQLSADGEDTLFIQRHVFPGGGLVHLSDEIRAAETAGFEVIDCENLRPHYARTCQAWADRLQANAAQCRQYVDEKTYRTWLLYLTASALNFESGNLDIHQVLLRKRSLGSTRHLTREYMYGPRQTAPVTSSRLERAEGSQK